MSTKENKKMKYTKKQIQESIKYWKGVLESMDEAEGRAATWKDVLNALSQLRGNKLTIIAGVGEAQEGVDNFIDGSTVFKAVMTDGVLNLHCSDSKPAKERMSIIAEIKSNITDENAPALVKIGYGNDLVDFDDVDVIARQIRNCEALDGDDIWNVVLD